MRFSKSGFQFLKWTLRVLLLTIVFPLASRPVPLPEFVKHTEISIDSVPKPGEALNGLYWLLFDTQIDIATHANYIHIAGKILSESGLQAFSHIESDFDPAYEKIDFHHIILWRNGKSADILPTLQPSILHREQNLEWEVLDGRKTMLFSLSDLRVGDVVEYDFTRHGGNPVFKGKSTGSEYLRYGFPVEDIHFSLRFPLDRKVFIGDLYGAPKGRRFDENGYRTFSWEIKKSKPLNLEDDAPSWYNIYPRVQWSEYETWSDVGEWARGCFPLDSPLPPDLAKKVSDWKNLAPRERVRRALRLAQDSIRYLALEMGASSHRPADPGTVYRRRFGDCKDKTTLFCALTRAMGIKAVPVLVNTATRGHMDDFQPSPLAFDHVIAKVELEDSTYWFDATENQQVGDPFQIQELPFESGLPLEKSGRKHIGELGVGTGLVVDRVDTDFDQIPLTPASIGENSVEQTIRISDWDSAADLKIVTTYSKGEAARVRAQYANNNRDELQKAFVNYYARAYPGIEAAAPISLEDDTANNRLVVTKSYRINNICESSKELNKKTCTILPKEILDAVGRPDVKIRSTPLARAYPHGMLEHIHVSLPEKITRAASKGEESIDEFYFSWRQVFSDTSVDLDYAYLSFADNVPVARFPSFLKSIDSVYKHLGATIYPGSKITHSSPNYLLIGFSLLCLAVGVWFSLRLSKVKAPTRRLFLKKPRAIGGFLILISLSLIFRPILFLYSLRSFFQFCNQEKWDLLTRVGEIHYNPMWGPLLLFEYGGGAFLTCLSFALWPMFFKRRNTFPKSFTWLILLSMAYTSIDQLGSYFLHRNDGLPNAHLKVGVTLASFGVAIAWMVYINSSVRVAETFVFPLEAEEGASSPTPSSSFDITPPAPSTPSV